MKKINKKYYKKNKEAINFIAIWLVVILSIGIMFLIMHYPSTNTSNKSLIIENENTFKSISSGDTTQGNVLIELTPHVPNNGKLIFDMSLNTHSVDMEQFNLTKITKLEIEGDIFSPSLVPIISGHHNSGELVFEIGKLNAKKFKIILTSIPNIELREFEWN